MVPNGSAAAADSPEAQPTGADAVLSQLTRVLASPGFSGAKSRAKFLEYVVQRTLAGQQESLKEYTIGVEVFDRGAQFDPKTDGVVRTQAGLVRRHLEQYYEGEGRHDPVLIVVPKGHYVPKFHFQPQSSGESRGEDLSGETRDRRPAFRRLLWASVGACVTVMALVGGGLARDKRAAGPDTPALVRAIDPVYLPLWGKFLEPGAPNVLAFGTPQFFTAGNIWVRDTRINGPTDADAQGYLRSLRQAVGSELTPAESYTGIGEAHGVYLLSRFFLGKSRDLRVVRSRTVSWDNLKQDNVIFLTSARFRTLADQLAYPSDFVHVLGPVNRVENRRPVADEKRWYEARTDGREYSIDHAIVTVWPGRLPGRRVMVLSGSHTWGTQAAAEYVTEPGYLRELNQHLADCQRRSGAPSHADFFQVLLRVEIRDNQPVSVIYVAHHDLEMDDLGPPSSVERTSVASGSALKVPQ